MVSRTRIYDVVKEIPAGRVSTYGDVAVVVGHARWARQVGYALAALDDESVPWHRVINASGRISARGDIARVVLQRDRLEAEGIRFDATGRVDLRALRFHFPLRDERHEAEGHSSPRSG